MGFLLDGIWHTDLVDSKSDSGKFRRQAAKYRNWITADGSPGPTGSGGFAAEHGRYHLYVSSACPWAHRTLIYRTLKDLSDLISVDVVHPVMGSDGWTFDVDGLGATGDRLSGKRYLREIYLSADPVASTRVTVPVLWDKKTGSIVSNESSDIIRMFNSAFNDLTGNYDDFYPAELTEQIEAVNARIYSGLNNGVYKAGFASTQEAYDEAVAGVFETLDWLEKLLSTRRYLVGNQVTEADWRLLTTLIRFDLVYHTHFKCNRSRIIDFPNIWAYTRDMFQKRGVSETVNFKHITDHYYQSHVSLNPHRIVPAGPDLNWGNQ